MIIRTVVLTTTGLNVSRKSYLKDWEYPFETNRALYLETISLEFFLSLNSHLQPITFWDEGRGIKLQVLLLIKAWSLA